MRPESPSSAAQPDAEVAAVASCAIGFEWMPFSGAVRLAGAEQVLPPGVSFWGAMAPGDRDAVRRSLARALVGAAPLDVECRLETQAGVRTFLMRGERVPGEPGMSSHIAGVLVETDILREVDAETRRRSLRAALATWAGVELPPPAAATADVLLAEAVGEAVDRELAGLLGDLSFVGEVLRNDRRDADVTEHLLHALGDAHRAAERLLTTGHNLLGFVQLHEVESVQPVELHRALAALLARKPDLGGGRPVAARKLGQEPVTAVVSPAHLDYAVSLAVGLAAELVPPGTAPGDPIVLVPHPAGPASVEIEIHPPGVTHRQPIASDRELAARGRVDLTLCRSLMERMGGGVELEGEPGSPPYLRISLPARFLCAAATDRGRRGRAVRGDPPIGPS